jgi:multiple sugar transport system ATP-binding protein
MATVVLRNVDKIYPRGKPALADLSLEIRDREFLVLVGPSGCGKSTLLRIVAGLEEATRGDVLIGERRVNDLPPRDRDVAMVFQSYALYPHMTAYDNIGFGLRIRGLPKHEIDEQVRDAARLLHIEGLLGKMPKALSGGERQRVALGRAIVRKPQVFLFDEPLSNLDAKLRSAMRAEISALHRRLQVTTVYVTHDQIEAMTMGERIVVLREGRIQQVGKPLELYHAPANRFVAGFIGNPSMNFFDAEFAGDLSVVHVCGRPIPLGTDGSGVPRSSDGSADQQVRPGSLPGSRVVLGLRPEDVRLDPEGPVPARVTLVEPMGGESFVHAEVPGGSIIARTPGDAPARIGEEIRLRFDVGRAHFFDPETEDRIS